MSDLKPFQILGRMYIPDHLVSEAYQLFDIPPHLRFGGSSMGSAWEYRRPDQSSYYAQGEGIISNGWHHDGGTAVILWASMFPTEIRLPDKSIVAGQPYDVVLINNEAVEHRTPLEYQYQVRAGSTPNRYFIRGSMYRRHPSLEEIAVWKRQLN